MMRSGLPWAVLAVALLSGCAASGRPFDGYFDAGLYRAAAEEGERDPGVRGDEEGMYRLALAHLAPGTGVYDPLRAEGLLNELLATWPEGNRALEARILSGQLAAVRRVTLSAHRARVRADSAETELARMTAQAGELQVRAEEGSREIERLRARIRALEAEVTARQEEVATLQRTLDELKRIDLQRSGGPPVPIAPAPGSLPRR